MKKTLLIAEDDSALLEAMRSKFASAGFEVVTCSNGTECMQCLQEKEVDGLVLDLLMPEKDGFQVLEERSSTPNANVPVYVVTNLGRDEDCRRAKAMGITACFVKSNVPLKEVIATIQEDFSVEPSSG